jgi:hypothetical protein
MDASSNEAVLRPDFAHRVVERVRKAKRRRQLYRWALSSAAGCALVISAILSLPARNLPQPPSILPAARSDGHSEWIASPSQELGGLREFNLPSFGQQPLAFFFPGATAVADFQSSEATYWHSYDPWWNPAGTLGSLASTRSQVE